LNFLLKFHETTTFQESVRIKDCMNEKLNYSWRPAGEKSILRPSLH